MPSTGPNSQAAPLRPAHIVWHRAELRVHDQPALTAAREAALASGGSVLPLAIIDDQIFGRPDLSSRRQAWFLANVVALREKYRSLGSNLLVRSGKPEEVLAQLAHELEQAGHSLASLHYVRNFTPYAAQRDAAVQARLLAAGIKVGSCPGHYVSEPGTVLTNTGGRYGVYSPYRRKWELALREAPHRAPRHLPSVPAGLPLGDIPVVTPDIPLPPAGEDAALGQLQRFLEKKQMGYGTARNLPAQEDGTSRLSYYLNIGALSSRVAHAEARDAQWTAELAWRDFFADVLERSPNSLAAEYDERWQGFPWRSDTGDLAAWKNGRTGYPMVDAGMRELAATGFMHNRLRMITASFLTKHLLLDWRLGEAHFLNQLLDGDRAQNVGNWQWTAGCGVDAAPFFRVFNPVGQGEKFDLNGDYVRRWVPELAHLPAKLVHKPWEAGLLAADYPAPIIPLEWGRDRFLETAKEALSRRQ